MIKPIIDLPIDQRFKLDSDFFNTYQFVAPPWGLGAFSELVFRRTYSRDLPGGAKEQWADTVKRVTEGTFTVLKWHCLRHNLPWSARTAQERAQRFFDGIFNLRWTPPGRGLWMMGTEFVYERGSTSLNNCGFKSTKDITAKAYDAVSGASSAPSKPFVWAFNKSMHGVGVGYNVDGAKKKLKILSPEVDPDWCYPVEDSREGWANVLAMVIDAHLVPGNVLPAVFDFREVREKGAAIKGFGGTASGPEALINLLLGGAKVAAMPNSPGDWASGFDADGDSVSYFKLRSLSEAETLLTVGQNEHSCEFTVLTDPARHNFILNRSESLPLSMYAVDEVPGIIHRFRDWAAQGRTFDSEIIVDLFNMCGRCVVAGGVRRSAMISLGDIDDEVFNNLKTDHSQPEMAWWRWCSNNSVIPNPVGPSPDYGALAGRICKASEPGAFWRENARNFGRMCDAPDYVDSEAEGVNPCLPGFARVLTPEGIRTFDQIQEGSTIWSEDGWVTVTRKWSTGIKPVFQYRTTAGAFTGTANHRVVENGLKVEVQDAEAIDRLVGPRASKSELDPQTVLDGWMIGDGTQAPARCLDEVYLCVGANDQDIYTSEVAHLLRGAHSNGRATDVAVTTTIQRAELTRLPQREIPERFQQGTPSVVAGFLRGLYSANGSVVSSGRRVTLKVTSPLLREQVQVMLSSLGISSYFTSNKPSEVVWNNGTYVSRESYDINITTDRHLFAEVVGFVQPYKQEKITGTTSQSGKRTFEIREIVSQGDFEVFDITVDGASHTFWTDGVNVSNCVEQTLFDGELCCLGETRPMRHASLKDYLATVKDAYLYTKVVTLIPTDDPETNKVMMRNRRIGLSMTGVRQNINRLGWREHFNWCDRAYKYVQEMDVEYSNWLGVARSIKTTSVKPSGTVSLLCGSTPGVHAAFSEWMIRRMRIDESSPIVDICRQVGIPVERALKTPNTWVMEYPIHMVNVGVTEETDTIENQFEVAAEMQRLWADNQVSCTVKFKEEEEHKIEGLLKTYARHLKGISLMKFSNHGYVQAPLEELSEEQYNARHAAIDWDKLNELLYATDIAHDQEDKFCDGDACLLPGLTKS